MITQTTHSAPLRDYSLSGLPGGDQQNTLNSSYLRFSFEKLQQKLKPYLVSFFLSANCAN